MARRRMRARTRGAFRGGFRRFAKKSGMGNSVQIFQLDAMGYGVVRPWISNLVTPLMQNIPILGQFGDEVGMGLVNYLLAKNTSGLIRDVAKKGLTIENYRVGEVLGAGIFGGASNASGSMSNYFDGGSY